MKYLILVSTLMFLVGCTVYVPPPQGYYGGYGSMPVYQTAPPPYHSSPVRYRGTDLLNMDREQRTNFRTLSDVSIDQNQQDRRNFADNLTAVRTILREVDRHRLVNEQIADRRDRRRHRHDD